MSTHSFYAPSAAARWMTCPGSQAFPENTEDSDAGVFAAEGTAAHMLADRALRYKRDAAFFLGEQLQVGERIFVVDDEMAMNVQIYLDYARDLAAGDPIFNEQRVDLSHVLGVEGGGTTDCAIPKRRRLHVIDLKYGKGVKVYAKENPQLRLYGLGSLNLMDLFGPFDMIEYTIVQPRVDHIDSWAETVQAAQEFGVRAANAVREAEAAIAAPEPSAWLHPSEHGCQWCKVKATCPALANEVQRICAADFDALGRGVAPVVPVQNAGLAEKFALVGIVEQWCKSIHEAIFVRVAAGEKFMGPDGENLKIVQGKPGKRKWRDSEAALAALVGQFADAAYAPAVPISPSVADKKLNGRRKVKSPIWTDVLAPLVTQPPGKAVIALGSDPREAWTPVATAQEFDDDADED